VPLIALFFAALVSTRATLRTEARRNELGLRLGLWATGYRSICSRSGTSGAWIEPSGRLQVVGGKGEVHEDVARRIVATDEALRSWAEEESREGDAEGVLVHHGWIRMANASVVHARGWRKTPDAAWATAAEITATCIESGVLPPDEPMWVGLEDDSEVRFEDTVAAFVGRILGRAAEERAYASWMRETEKIT